MKSELKQKLSRLEGFQEPDIELEQYVTPAELAADMLHAAFMRGDIEGKKVLDLGSGTGILAIGASLLGGKVTAIEKDPGAIEVAKRNAEKLDAEVEFRQSDIDEFSGSFDTCVMNPPFSVHSESFRQFLGKAVSVSNAVYSLAPADEALKEFLAEHQHELEADESYTISLPATYGFHTRKSEEVEVKLIVTRRK